MGRRMIIWLLLAIILVIFALLNVVTINVKFFFWELTDVPLPLVILLSLLLGAIAMALISWPRTFKLRRTIKSLEKKITELEESNSSQSKEIKEDHNNFGPRIEGDTNTRLFED